MSENRDTKTALHSKRLRKTHIARTGKDYLNGIRGKRSYLDIFPSVVKSSLSMLRQRTIVTSLTADSSEELHKARVVGSRLVESQMFVVATRQEMNGSGALHGESFS